MPGARQKSFAREPDYLLPADVCQLCRAGGLETSRFPRRAAENFEFRATAAGGCFRTRAIFAGSIDRLQKNLFATRNSLVLVRINFQHDSTMTFID